MVAIYVTQADRIRFHRDYLEQNINRSRHDR